MNAELFEGTPEQMLARINTLLGGPATNINQVLKTTGGQWLIIWS